MTFLEANNTLQFNSELIYVRHGLSYYASVHHFGRNRVCIRFIDEDEEEKFYWCHAKKLTPLIISFFLSHNNQTSFGHRPV